MVFSPLLTQLSIGKDIHYVGKYQFTIYITGLYLTGSIFRGVRDLKDGIKIATWLSYL